MRKRFFFVAVTTGLLLFVICFGFIPISNVMKNGLFSGILFRSDLGNFDHKNSAMEFIGNLISTYSIFITLVIFLGGIPLAVYSYNSSKKNEESIKELKDEFKSTLEEHEEFKKQYEKKLDSVKAEIAENNAYNIIDKAYNDDPESLNQGEGKKGLEDFSKCFEEKQVREAKRYFFEGLKYKQDKDKKNINHVNINNDLYNDKELQQLMISVEYFSMCEKMFPYESNGISLYREKASVLKCLGLYYYYHNSILAMDYFLSALEYFQKAVQSDEYDVLPFNSKSNTLKDMYRLIKETEDPKVRHLLLEKIKNNLMMTSVCILDLKVIATLIESTPQEYRICFTEEKELTMLKENIGYCKKRRCFESQRICDKCQLYLHNLADDILLNIILLESIVCVYNDVLIANKLKGTDKEFKQWCYLTCAISYFMLFTFSENYKGGKTDKTEEDYWYANFIENLIESIQAGYSSGKTIKEFINELIKPDKDLENFTKIKDWEIKLLERVDQEIAKYRLSHE